MYTLAKLLVAITHDCKIDINLLSAIGQYKKNNYIIFSDNVLRVVVYYGDLSYELLEQQKSYDTLAWLGRF